MLDRIETINKALDWLISQIPTSELHIENEIPDWDFVLTDGITRLNMSAFFSEEELASIYNRVGFKLVKLTPTPIYNRLGCCRGLKVFATYEREDGSTFENKICKIVLSNEQMKELYYAIAQLSDKHTEYGFIIYYD